MAADQAGQRRKEASLGGWILGRRGYQCRELLGSGAFSGVYRVEDPRGGGRYACKISEDGKMLEREARAMEALDHPLFPAYFDFWQEAGLGFLLREYVEGSSLEELLARREIFPAKETVRVGLALAEGLSYLHGRPERFLFRDVKPANVMLCGDGGVKLIDLGCVCPEAEWGASRAGTPGFAAPEQLERAGALTPSCDVYGLGQTMKAMLGTDDLGGWKGRRLRRRLGKVLEACTREAAGERVLDMAHVISALRELQMDFQEKERPL